MSHVPAGFFDSSFGQAASGADEIHACASDTKVIVPTHLVPLPI
jgi:hypothetical protein